MGTAVISPCQKYRFLLTRELGGDGGTCLFIMLNPSTADASTDDPTIRRCIGFAQRLGCSRLEVVNLFAYRATSPEDMKRASDPVGDGNLEHLGVAATKAQYVIAAWGAHGSYRQQGEIVLGILELIGVRARCLGKTKDGIPRHPLYLPSDATLIEL